MNALLLFVVGALAVLPGLSATTRLVMSFKEAVDESVLVARVRIQKMTPVRYAAKDGDRICGHRYSFSPVEVFKSDASPSDSFFAEAGSDYRGNEIDHLVLVFSRGTQTPDEALAQLQGGDEDERRRLRCVLSEQRYALADPTTMIPIESLADDSPQQWLRLRDPTIFPIHAIGEGDLRERGPEMLVRWEAAASLIRQVIEKKADP